MSSSRTARFSLVSSRGSRAFRFCRSITKNDVPQREAIAEPYDVRRDEPYDDVVLCQARREPERRIVEKSRQDEPAELDGRELQELARLRLATSAEGKMLLPEEHHDGARQERRDARDAWREASELGERREHREVGKRGQKPRQTRAHQPQEDARRCRQG